MEFPSTRALDGLDLAVSVWGHRPGRGERRGQDDADLARRSACSSPTPGSIRVLGLDPATDGPELRARIGYGPERNVLPDDLRAYDFVRHLARGQGPAPRRGPQPSERLALSRRARRGAVPGARDDVDRATSAGEARSGDRRRPEVHRARRADRRSRPGAARRDAQHHRPGQPRVRDRRDAVVARARGGRADLRPRRRARRTARSSPRDRWTSSPARPAGSRSSSSSIADRARIDRRGRAAAASQAA